MAEQPRNDDRRRGKQRYAARSRWGRRSWTGGIVIGALILAILGLRAAGVFEPAGTNVDLNAARVVPGEIVGTKMPDQGNSHIPDNQTKDCGGALWPRIRCASRPSTANPPGTLRRRDGLNADRTLLVVAVDAAVIGAG